MLERLAPSSGRIIDDLINNLSKIKISNLIGNHKSKSEPDLATIRGEFELNFLFGLCNNANVHREAIQSKSISSLRWIWEKLIQLGANKIEGLTANDQLAVLWLAPTTLSPG